MVASHQYENFSCLGGRKWYSFFFGDCGHFVVGNFRQLLWLLKGPKWSSGFFSQISLTFACFQAKTWYCDLGTLPAVLFRGSILGGIVR